MCVYAHAHVPPPGQDRAALCTAQRAESCDSTQKNSQMNNGIRDGESPTQNETSESEVDEFRWHTFPKGLKCKTDPWRRRRRRLFCLAFLVFWTNPYVIFLKWVSMGVLETPNKTSTRTTDDDEHAMRTHPVVASATAARSAPSGVPEESALHFEFPLRLSRAFLGKIKSFSWYESGAKRRNKTFFPGAPSATMRSHATLNG